MRRKNGWWGIAAGLALCVLVLALSVVMQEMGYLTYLNSDMSSEMILARRQADTGSLIQMDWIYSTEIHTIHMNLFYALAFLFTPDYMWARIIGNTIGFVIAMVSCVCLCRRLGLSVRRGLFTAALLPFAGSVLYAANMTIGGYYIIHLPFAFGGAALWLDACEGGRGRWRSLMTAALFAALCALEGLLSVRYVLCFICPMVVVAGLDVLLAPQLSRTLRDHHLRFGGVTAAGFAGCLAGFAASEVLYPHLFTSGTGSASSFMFNALDGNAMLAALATVAADFLKLLGWRGGAALFSLAGIGNLCVAAVLVLGGMMTVRVYRALEAKDAVSRAQKRLLDYAMAAFAVNLFCFVFIKGTYLNRYLILAVLFFIPAAAVVVSREKNLRMRLAFLLLLCAMLGATGTSLVLETRAQKPQAEASGADMMDMAERLIEDGYTHGYGTFWHVRVMQERTQGALTFTGVWLTETEEGALCPISLEMMRWLEPLDAAHMDVCAGKTFLLLTHEEAELFAPWLKMTGAPVIYENGTYAAYGFESSQRVVEAMLLARMKLTGARESGGVYTLEAGGRMRVPTNFREAGTYRLSFFCEGNPQSEGRAAMYITRHFEVAAQCAIVPGENELTVTLGEDDNYFMILLEAAEAEGLTISGLRFEKI